MANPISRDLAPIIKWIAEKLAKNPQTAEEEIIREASSKFKKEANPTQIQNAFDEAAGKKAPPEVGTPEPKGKVQQAVINKQEPLYTTGTKNNQNQFSSAFQSLSNQKPEPTVKPAPIAEPALSAEEKAGKAFELLGNDKTPIYRSDSDTLKKISEENPKYTPEQIAEEFKKANAPVSTPAVYTVDQDIPSAAKNTALKTGAKVLLGTGATATVVGMTATGIPIIKNETTGEENPVYKPVIVNGKLQPSEEELSFINKKYAGKDTLRGGNYRYGTTPEQAIKAKREEYQEIEDQALENTKNEWKTFLKKDYSSGLESSPEFQESLAKEKQRLIDRAYGVVSEQPVSSTPEQPLTKTPAPAAATTEEAPSEPTEKPVTPPPVTTKPPSTTGKPATTIAAAIKAPSEEKRAVEPTKKPTAKVAAAQASFPNSLAGLLTADLALADSLTGGGKPVDRSGVKDAMDKLARVDEEIKTMYDGKVPPELVEVSRARRDAFKAYKEQARVNDWLSIVDRAIGAIGQFASAQAAMGTPYIGNYKPSTIDYDSKTQQALREYQAEVGLLQQEREESEQARSRFFKEKEMTADQLYKKYQLGLEKAKLEFAEKEDIQNRADKWSKTVFDALQDDRKENKRLAQATLEFQQKQAIANEKKTDEAKKDLFTATNDLLKVQASQLENEIKKIEGYIAATTEYANKDSPENRAAFAKAHGKDIAEEVEEKDTILTSEAGTRKNILQGIAANASARLQKLRDNLDKIQEQQVKLLQGRVAGAAPESPAGQEPSGGGKVPEKKVLYPAGSIVEQNGKKYKVLKDYSAGDSANGVFEEVK